MAQSKAEFVRSLPPSMSAKEVIAKAKAAGLALSPAYIYVIRSKSERRANDEIGSEQAWTESFRWLRAGKAVRELGPGFRLLPCAGAP